jgi:hypothetical protein
VPGREDGLVETGGKGAAATGAAAADAEAEAAADADAAARASDALGASGVVKADMRSGGMNTLLVAAAE